MGFYNGRTRAVLGSVAPSGFQFDHSLLQYTSANVATLSPSDQIALAVQLSAALDAWYAADAAGNNTTGPNTVVTVADASAAQSLSDTYYSLSADVRAEAAREGSAVPVAGTAAQSYVSSFPQSAWALVGTAVQSWCAQWAKAVDDIAAGDPRLVTAADAAIAAAWQGAFPSTVMSVYENPFLLYLEAFATNPPNDGSHNFFLTMSQQLPGLRQAAQALGITNATIPEVAVDDDTVPSAGVIAQSLAAVVAAGGDPTQPTQIRDQNGNTTAVIQQQADGSVLISAPPAGASADLSGVVNSVTGFIDNVAGTITGIGTEITKAGHAISGAAAGAQAGWNLPTTLTPYLVAAVAIGAVLFLGGRGSKGRG